MSADASYGLQQELRPKRAAPRWGLWSTLLWGAGLFLASVVLNNLAVYFFLTWWAGAYPSQPITLSNIGTHGPLLGTVTVLTTPLLLGLVLWAVHLSRVPFRDYLALRWPSVRQFLVGVLLIVILIPVGDLITAHSGRDVVPRFMTGIIASARDAGPPFMVLIVLAMAIMAPLWEEVLFRGFLYRGIAGRLGPAIAIIAPSLLWAALHVQYELFFIVQIFVIGIVFGILRWRSNSLYLVVFLHALINTLAALQAMEATPATA